MSLTADQQSALEPVLRTSTGSQRIARFDTATVRLTGVCFPVIGFVRTPRTPLIHGAPRAVRITVDGAGRQFIVLTVKSPYARTSAARLLAMAMLALAAGVVIAALTTRERGWWQEAFSKLGTIPDFSGVVFNLTLIVASFIVAGYALRLRMDLLRLARRGGSRVAPNMSTGALLVAATGLFIAGSVPESVALGLHQSGALAMTASLIFLLSSTPWLFRTGASRLHIATGSCALALSVGIAVFVTGVVNLTVFELVMFTLFFAWMATFTWHVRSRLAARHGGYRA